MFVLGLFVILGALVYYRWIKPWKRARRPPRNIELVSKPTVLILYTDDCAEHSEAVWELADLIKVYGNAQVSLDQIDLVDPSKFFF